MQDIKVDFNNSIIIKNDDIIKIEENEEIIQNIKIEMVTNEGDVFYDLEFGYSLYDFLHREIDEMLINEIKHRIITKLSKRDYVDSSSINIETKEKIDKLIFNISFYINEYFSEITLLLDRVKVEVI
ncbi:DUF2634 domain-containing protein [[Clostridium] colinum]|uniref:DUF2634 domain-containing protein n=1 Tax=[Clostridium] colinum TaxID=36835 RepID=UPI0020250027|nr:DUF2634 domain-containing protein [[Clostridium] colinum]